MGKGGGDDDDLSRAVSELKGAPEAPVTNKHVPSVLVVFRDRFDTALERRAWRHHGPHGAAATG